MGQTPDLSTSSVVVDVCNRHARKLAHRRAREGCGAGWQWRGGRTKKIGPPRSVGPGIAGLAEVETESRKWKDLAQLWGGVLSFPP